MLNLTSIYNPENDCFRIIEEENPSITDEQIAEKLGMDVIDYTDIIWEFDGFEDRDHKWYLLLEEDAEIVLGELRKKCPNKIAKGA